MRYLMRQDLFSFGDDYTIKDEHGREVYKVDGRAFTLLREKLSFEDMAGKELAFIREKLIALTDAWEILRDGKQVAVVKKDLINLFRCGFTVDVPLMQANKALRKAGFPTSAAMKANAGGRTWAAVQVHGEVERGEFARTGGELAVPNEKRVIDVEIVIGLRQRSHPAPMDGAPGVAKHTGIRQQPRRRT